jgi:hypothetical protein
MKLCFWKRLFLFDVLLKSIKKPVFLYVSFFIGPWLLAKLALRRQDALADEDEMEALSLSCIVSS